ncbi:unnamed protein product [Musa textilis]
MLILSKVIAAYLLAVLGGNISPTGDDLKVILESVAAIAGGGGASAAPAAAEPKKEEKSRREGRIR